ncbi:MAG: hypothetical protein K6T61_13780 [Bryobacteraceae bacterium]|nr:hypothetical protein [Bryobacteraceae bacterium]
MRVAAIADDTTGALEVGAKLAEAGIRTVVAGSLSTTIDAEALVIDARSRRMGPEEAYRRVRESAWELRRAGVEHLYKKTDSTLRGNIAAEFQALVDVFTDRPLLYVPAYPQMGRTVRNGELFVYGKPLAETEFARDALNPATEGKIASLLAAGCQAPVRLVADLWELEGALREAPGGCVVVCDGTAPPDLEKAAQAMIASGRLCVAAGTAGYCGPWAEVLPLRRRVERRQVTARRCLVASGSRNPITARQLGRARELGMPISKLPDSAAEDEATVQQLAAALRKEPWAMLATSGTSPEDVSLRIGSVVRRVVEQVELDGLVVFGGDTAAGVLRALGVEAVEPLREVLPGVPLSSIELRDRRLAFVTKAGGFGGVELVGELRRALGEDR